MVGEAMKLYSKNENYKLYQGSMLDMLEVIDKESIDAILTDPPYELNFMGKGWDNAGISFQPDTWKKCYEVLKPGGYLLAFGGSRTFHRIAVAIEDAGFEIRDTIMWLYGSGFPKSMALDKALEAKLTTGSGNKTGFRKLNGELVDRGDYGYAKMQNEQGNRPADYNKIEEQRLGKLEATTDLAKKYSGWGTCLKPSFEPIIVARKPFKGSLVDNVIEYGVGGINVDECRVEAETNRRMCGSTEKSGETSFILGAREETYTNKGRFPANTILTYDDTDFDTTSWLRYFYCAKASKRDRDEGLDEFADNYMAFSNQAKAELKRGNVDFKDNEDNPLNFVNSVSVRKNTHPTVKPTELMQYLVRLVSPEGATILDPFNGSGSTGKAVMYENYERNKSYKYIGIELTEEYLPISKARIEYVCSLEPEVNPQMSIFDLECENENTK